MGVQAYGQPNSAEIVTGVGYTFFNDPPPGAGGLNAHEYCFAELGTATQGGQATGSGFLAKALGLPGELPMGAVVTMSNGSQSIDCVKRDRGFGQGDPFYAVDFWDGTAFGGKNPMTALGLSGGKGSIPSVSYQGKTVSGGGASGNSSVSGSLGDLTSMLPAVFSPLILIAVVGAFLLGSALFLVF